jgi:tetratricopeptide (TPR) repeat protein
VRKSILICLSFCLLFLSGAGRGRQFRVAAQEQETFRNPAMEPADEFQQTFTRARVLMRQGNAEEAINEFKKAASLHNNQCADCFQMIGQINLQTRNYKEAAAAFRQAADLKPGNEAEVLNALGVSLYLQDDKTLLADAAAAMKRAIELSGGKLKKAYYNLGYILIKSGKQEEGIRALKTYLELDPSTPSANEVRAIIANTKLIDERFAPDFKINSTSGQALSLEKLKGKVVLLDFWASWCVPCRVEMPEVRRIWKTYGGDRFVIIGVNLDRNEQAFAAYVKQEEITWPQYFDGQGWNNKMSRLYNVSSIPQTVLIDQNGIVRAVGLRGIALSNKIGELLKQLH